METNFKSLIMEICRDEGISVQSFSSDWAFRLEKNGKHCFIVGYTFSNINGASRQLVTDKALTSEVLAAVGIPSAVHMFAPDSTTKAKVEDSDTDGYAKMLLERDGSLVVKDNYGTGGDHVFHVFSLEEYRETVKAIHTFSVAAAVSPFYEIVDEYRVVMLQGKPRLTIRKDRAFHLDEAGNRVYETWKHNLGRGATGVIIEDPETLRPFHEIAEKTVKALDTDFCSVDIIDIGTEKLVLEVNGGVMMEFFSGQSEKCRQIAYGIYRDAIRAKLQ